MIACENALNIFHFFPNWRTNPSDCGATEVENNQLDGHANLRFWYYLTGVENVSFLNFLYLCFVPCFLSLNTPSWSRHSFFSITTLFSHVQLYIFRALVRPRRLAALRTRVSTHRIAPSVHYLQLLPWARGEEERKKIIIIKSHRHLPESVPRHLRTICAWKRWNVPF